MEKMTWGKPLLREYLACKIYKEKERFFICWLIRNSRIGRHEMTQALNKQPTAHRVSGTEIDQPTRYPNQPYNQSTNKPTVNPLTSHYIVRRTD